jgi:hypothetical protein
MDRITWCLVLCGALLMGCLYAITTALYFLGADSPTDIASIWREWVGMRFSKSDAVPAVPQR